MGFVKSHNNDRLFPRSVRESGLGFRGFIGFIGFMGFRV